MNDLALSEETAISPSDVFINGKSLTQSDIEADCRMLVDELYQTGDSSNIQNAILNLNGVEMYAAKAKSKLIFEFGKWFGRNNPQGDFSEWYIQKFGGEKLTVQKHLAIGELLTSDDVPEDVKQLNSKELVSVARAKQSGYDLDEHWEEIAHAGSEAEINAVIRKVKGKPERQGTLNIKVYGDGSIMGFMGDAVANLGWLNFADRDSDETKEEIKNVLKIGIARIINNSRAKEA